VCILLNELATLIFFMLVLVLMPLSLGYPFWPVSCKESRAGQLVLSVCHTVQAALLPVLFVFFLLFPLAPLLWFWQPEGGWVALDPLVARPPALSDLPSWPCWLVQSMWLLLCGGAYQLLLRAPSTGAFKPRCCGSGLIQTVSGLLSGKHVVWTMAIDPCVGGVVRFCYCHRRSCGCIGELLVAVWLPGFAAWPLAFALVYARGLPLDEAVAWWTVTVASVLFLMFHAVRLGKTYWTNCPVVVESRAAPRGLQ